MAMILPELYNQCNNLTVSTTKDHLAKYKGLIKWKNEESIMELGVGDGNCSMYCLQPFLPSRYKEFVAMDISEAMLEYAKNNINLPNARFVQCDVGSEEIDDEFIEKFDHIFSFYCIHMIENISEAFKNLYKMLKPGGQMFLTVMEYSLADMAFHKLSEVPRWEKYGKRTTVSPFYYSESPKEEYIKLLQTAGFKNYVLETERIDFELGGEDMWQKLCIAINPLLPKIAAEELEDYKLEYLNQLRKSTSFSFKNNNSNISTNFNMFIIVANKS
ncbi:juvenile hormone acid O-methyltransferase [Diabrotica virgifera virgifera]|uniref:Juvenile hormone acid O-methyltransferase-like n=1 Tax=Diabrotica virgifera virgifera TaxID=50390 RepID=A0A6P7FJF4_DIAVI|nr:juvenile hormone acid O-methyltransferase [Diabrotica virgifera virgifera]